MLTQFFFSIDHVFLDYHFNVSLIVLLLIEKKKKQLSTMY